MVDSLTQQQIDVRAKMAAQPREPLALAQNVDVAGQETDDGDGDLDGDGEDGMDDDDMMDKMSSSPSIDDGGLPCAFTFTASASLAVKERPRTLSGVPFESESRTLSRSIQCWSYPFSGPVVSEGSGALTMLRSHRHHRPVG